MPYQFQSPGAAAGNAIEQFLMQRAQQQRQQMLDSLMAERQAADDEDRKRRIGLDEQRFAAAQARQAAEDAREAEERDAAQRQQTNASGVRGMMADAMTQGPLTPDSAKTIGIMAFREGIEAPPEVQQQQADARAAQARSAGLADHEARQMIDASIDAQQPEGDQWRNAGAGSIFHAGTGQFRQAPQQGGSVGGAPSQGEQFALDTADRVIEAIDSLMPTNAPDSRINNWTAGVGGTVLRNFPGTDAANVSADLETVAGNIAFNALQQMREASKTGGALGSIAQQELRLLQSVEGSLRQDQSPANLRAQLAKVRQSMDRYRMAQQGQIQRPGGRASGAGPATGGGGFRILSVE